MEQAEQPEEPVRQVGFGISFQISLHSLHVDNVGVGSCHVWAILDFLDSQGSKAIHPGLRFCIDIRYRACRVCIDAVCRGWCLHSHCLPRKNIANFFHDLDEVSMTLIGGVGPSSEEP
jgi:hypothetical protein